MFAFIRWILLFLLRLFSKRYRVFLGTRIEEINHANYLIVTWSTPLHFFADSFYIVLREKNNRSDHYQFSSLENETNGENWYKLGDIVETGRAYILEFKDLSLRKIPATPTVEVVIPGGVKIRQN